MIHNLVHSKSGIDNLKWLRTHASHMTMTRLHILFMYAHKLPVFVVSEGNAWRQATVANCLQPRNCFDERRLGWKTIKIPSGVWCHVRLRLIALYKNAIKLLACFMSCIVLRFAWSETEIVSTQYSPNQCILYVNIHTLNWQRNHIHITMIAKNL